MSPKPRFRAAEIEDNRAFFADAIEPIKGLKTWTDGFNNLFTVVR